MKVPKNTTAIDLAFNLSGSLTGFPAILNQLPVGERIGFDNLPLEYEDVTDIGQTWTPYLQDKELTLDVPIYNTLGAEKKPYTTDIFSVEKAYRYGSFYNVMDSFYIDSTNVKHVFNSYENPVSVFCGRSLSIVISGVTVLKSSIKEIHFGGGYEFTTHIPDEFLFEFINLISVNLDSFINVISIGILFMYLNAKIPSVNLSSFSKVEKLDRGFLRSCSLLTTVDISNMTSLKSIADQFLMDAAILSTLNVGSLPATVFSFSVNTLSAQNASYLMYVNGVTVVGDNASGILLRLRNRDTAPFRKLKL